MDQTGGCRPALLAWHAGLAMWLLAASQAYQSQPVWSLERLGVSGVLLAAGLWAGGLHRHYGTGISGLLPRLPLCFVLTTLLRLGVEWIQPGHIDLIQASWFAGMFVLLAVTSTLLIARLSPAQPPVRTGTEALRWLILAGLTVFVYASLYNDRPSGGGDAEWYRIMLADFITQERVTGLPIWAGQTEYAFNGAVIPLRLAPWYQHAGAIVDWLTCRALSPVVLSNLILALNALAGAFSAYFCFRALVPRQPWNALALAFLYIASPAVFSPLSVGDQYLTFMTAPFLPVSAYALWRICREDDAPAYLLLAAALAALWQSHPPIALCMCAASAAALLARLLLRPGFRRRHALIALIVFVCLGSLPFVSVYALGPAATSAVPLNSRAIESNLENFPAVFLPLTANLSSVHTGYAARHYQPGYAALLVGTLGLLVFAWRRTLAGGILLFLIALVAVFLLPVPGVNAFLWNHVPGVVMQVLNTWPIQRLAGLWVILMLVLGAGSLALIESARRTWIPVACFWVLLLPASVWTASQAHLFISRRLHDTAINNADWRSAYEKHNLTLTRYAFNPFSTLPSYFSHGYIDPVFEHRLLRRDLTLLTSNAESAVRRGPRPAPDPTGSARLAHGTWRAVNDNQSNFYNLLPRLTLPPHKKLALWLEPMQPGQAGWLQIIGQDVFREYILPDSGAGVANRHTLGGFGTLPSSSKVISLFTRHPQENPRSINIAPDHTPAHTDFDFAHFELWTYESGQLPIEVKAWNPYRVIVHDAPEPAYLETPRSWLPHYRAKINGRRVWAERSPGGLAMFAVPAGYSDATIKYVPPLWLELTYWLNVGSWVALLAAGLVWLLLGHAKCAPPGPDANPA